ncbi:MAG TPA: SRPBCC domain-containing protein [Marmoricola sp.]|nr:SRPBCC domain-containing protein [Marmoricola sp.]
MTITTQDYETTLTVDASPETVFAAVTHPEKWWTGELNGAATRVDDEFTYRYPGHHYTKQRVTELVPEAKVVWTVTEADLPNYPDPTEWTGTEIVFEITPVGDQTELRFTHHGLAPALVCYDNCSSGWDFFINNSLQPLITTGEGPATPPWA